MNRLVIVFIVLLLAGIGYVWYQKEAAAAEFEKQHTELERTHKSLEAEARRLEVQNDSMRAELKVLSERLADTRLAVDELRRKPGLEQRLQRSYPQLAETRWGVVDVYDPADKRYVEYMLVPLWMSETFIIDHQNAEFGQRCR